MWYIKIAKDISEVNYDAYDFAGFQILEKYINSIYDSMLLYKKNDILVYCVSYYKIKNII